MPDPKCLRPSTPIAGCGHQVARCEPHCAALVSATLICSDHDVYGNNKWGGQARPHSVNPSRIERRLAAILAADVAGYSRLMGIDEIGTLNALKEHRRARIDPAIAHHNGRIVKTTGDGLLVEFASVVDAVGCAVAIQRALLAFNAGVHNDRQIVLCIGINVGDIIFDGGDIFGDGVNVAARLEALCEAGGVCISRYANEHRGDEWRAAENEIRKLRGSAKQKALPAHQNLAAIVAHEVEYQYALWHGDAEGALSAARPQRVTTAHRQIVLSAGRRQDGCSPHRPSRYGHEMNHAPTLDSAIRPTVTNGLHFRLDFCRQARIAVAEPGRTGVPAFAPTDWRGFRWCKHRDRRGAEPGVLP